VGANSWDERMEHVGKHFEGKGGVNGAKEPTELKEEEDDDLKEWSLKEGIVQDFGSRGIWLLGSEPAGMTAKRGARGRVAKKEPMDEDEDMDANGEDDH